MSSASAHGPMATTTTIRWFINWCITPSLARRMITVSVKITKHLNREVRAVVALEEAEVTAAGVAVLTWVATNLG